MKIESDLTVIIPIYNKEDTIQRALKSIKNQRMKPSCVIVVDDGSTDCSLEKVKEFSHPKISIKIIEQQNNGVSSARNRGAGAAETEYIAFLDADDEWLPSFTMNLYELIIEAPESDFYSLSYIKAHGSVFTMSAVAVPENFKGKLPNFISTYSKGYGLICSSTVCYKRSSFLIFGGFPISRQNGEDVYFWLKSALEGSGAFINRASAVIHKDDRNSKRRRETTIPYHIDYFSSHLDQYSRIQQQQIKSFLVRNIYHQWAASKIEKNRWQRNMLREYCRKLSVPNAVVLYLAEALPSIIFRFIRDYRNRKASVSGKFFEKA